MCLFFKAKILTKDTADELRFDFIIYRMFDCSIDACV